MPTKTTSSNLFTPKMTADLFSKVKGHSTIAKLCKSEPIPFAGTDYMTFSMDGEASIVGEGEQKPAGNAGFGKITIKPLKIVYQHRVTDEFVNLANEARIPYLSAFNDGFAKKIARAIDIMDFHGVNPATNTASSAIGDNCFKKTVTQLIAFNSANPDDDIDKAVTAIQKADGEVSGIAMSPAFGAALGSMKTGSEHVAMYPEFRFGGNPATFGSLSSDINGTVSFGNDTTKAIVGDFANAVKWGYAEIISMEVIQYGDPDGQGDLKRTNEICLRAEAYVGWGILEPDSFARIVSTAAQSDTFTGDGSTTEFTLTKAPVGELTSVKVDGTANKNYTVSGKTITFATAPANSKTILIDYNCEG